MNREQTCDEMIARSMSFTQWEFLAEHFNGEPRPILHQEMRTRQAMIARGLVKAHPRSDSFMPKFTVLTEKGHGVMCAAMGMMADMLTAIGHERERKAMEKWGYGKRTAAESHSLDGDLSLHLEHRS